MKPSTVGGPPLGQEGLGLRVVTDGEFCRESWRLGFVSKVKGFGRAEAVADRGG